MKTPLTFTAAGPVYGFAPGVKACDIEDQLYARQAQLEGLLAMTHDEGGEAFRGLAHNLQDGFMWACSMIAREVRELTEALQECRAAERGGVMSVPLSNIPAVQPIRPEEMVAFLEVCIDTFGRLAALMNAIQESSPADSDAARHADTGWHGACWMEGAARLILEQLQKGGVQR